MNAIIISYEEALCLKEYDVGVLEASSGEWSRFSDNEWTYKGRKMPVSEILENFGTGFVDELYTFVWVRVDS